MNAHAFSRVFSVAATLFLYFPIWAAQPEAIVREGFDQDPILGWEFHCEKALVTEGNGRILRLSGAGHAIYPLEAKSFTLRFRCRYQKNPGLPDIILRSQPPVYYAVTLTPDAVQILRLKHNNESAGKLLKSAPFDFKPGRWHDVAVDVHDGQMEVEIDGRQAASLDSIKPPPAGPVGIGIVRGSTAIDYDDVVLSFKKGEPSRDSSGHGSEAIKTLTVTLQVSEDAGDLKEPVALDLGLGFPLWLHPLGREPGERVPFGAFPQHSTASHVASAGSRVSFTFDSSGEAGEDLLNLLRTTPQLLADTTISDINRVGITSFGLCDWRLGGYEIRVNGQPFASSQAADAAGQQAARDTLTRLDAHIAAIRKEIVKQERVEKPTKADREHCEQLNKDLTSLRIEKNALQVRHKLAPGVEDARQAAQLRIKQIEKKLGVSRFDRPSHRAESTQSGGQDAAVWREIEQLEKQLDGEYPWFLDADFRSAKMSATSDEETPRIQSATVTLETCTHGGANTRNFVYFFAGGHKYLLGSDIVPLSGEKGPQRFKLDLTSAPLSAQQPTQWGLGMLAGPSLYAAAPDRWHPQRVMVEVNGKVAYDSELDSLDRRSLQAIRLIPPAHFDENGQIVKNSSTSREVYVWRVGSGAGLDKEGDKALPLPLRSDPNYPQPEPGLPAEAPPPGLDMPVFPPGASPLPGEAYPGPGWQPPPSGGPGWTPPPGWQAPPGWQPPKPPPAPQGSIPVTTGQPFHVKNVRLTSGWKVTDAFTIEWDCAGEQSQISHFHVSLRVVRPDKSAVYFVALAKNDKVPVGARKWTTLITKSIAGQISEPFYFVAPMVVAVPKDPKQSSPHHECIGRARAFFPFNANPTQQLLPRWYTFTDNVTSTTTAKKNIPHGPPPKQALRAVWTRDHADSHYAVPFGSPRPGSHVAARTQQGDIVTVCYKAPNISGKRIVVAHVGFLGGSKGSNQVDVDVDCSWVAKTGEPLFAYRQISRRNVTATAPLRIIERPVDTADAGGAGPFDLEVRFTFKGGAIDLAHPPALFGVRLLHIPAGKFYLGPPIRADLAIVPEQTRLIPGKVRGAKFHAPVVAVQNHGPHDIPAEKALGFSLSTKYEVGGWGDKRSDAGATHTLMNKVPTDQPWRKGEIRFIKPTHPQKLPGGQFLTWQKLFFARTEIAMPLNPDLVDPKGANNVYEKTHEPPLVLGEGAGPYEVLAFPKFNYGGQPASWECKPSLRHRLITYVGDAMNDRILSLKVGSKVQVTGYEGPGFYSPVMSVYYQTRNCPGLSNKEENAISSMIIYKRGDRMSGANLRDINYFSREKRDFPLPEDASQKEARYGHLGGFNNDADVIELSGPTGSIEAALYDEPGFQSPLVVLKNSAASYFELDDYDCEDDVSSLIVRELTATP